MAKRWTKKEDQYIIDNYQSKTISVIAYKLNRTRNAVTVRAYHLKVRKSKQRDIQATSKNDYRRQLSKLRIQERIERRVCSKCSNKAVSKMYCQKCLDKMKKYNKQYYKRRRNSQQSGE